ncbi:MAG: hypothetical protein EU549_04820, partial [Promethearchaeota archaeon]
MQDKHYYVIFLLSEIFINIIFTGFIIFEPSETSTDLFHKRCISTSESLVSISIDGNYELQSNSKVTGNGTWSNPYTIENYEFSGAYSGNRIEIQNTNKPLVIQNCTIQNFTTAIYIQNVSNVEIINSSFINGTDAFDLSNVNDIKITIAILRGIEGKGFKIKNSFNVTIFNSSAQGIGETYDCEGIKAFDSKKIALKYSTFWNFHKSCFFTNVSYCYFRYNHFFLTYEALDWDGELQLEEDTDNVIFEHNFLQNMTYNGLEIYKSKNYTIQFNTIENVNAGLRMVKPPLSDIRFKNNTIKFAELNINGTINLNISGNDITNGSINLSNSSRVRIDHNNFCNGFIVV